MRKLLSSLGFILVFLSLTSKGYTQNCIAPLNGGTLSPFQTTVCPARTVSIMVTGSSTGTGLSYQWESSTDNITWAPLNGYTGQSLFKTQSAPTWYRRKITCDAGGTAWSNSVQILVSDFNTCYCSPPSSNCSSGGISITKVLVGSINNSSGCGTNGYTNYISTVAPANIMQGSYLPVNITVASGISSYLLNCYIDYNHDGEFDAKETTTLFTPIANVYSGYIKVPFNARIGLTRMRISYSNTSSGTACFPGSNSETEDYAINITANTTSVTGHVIYVRATGATTTAQYGMTWASAVPRIKDALNLATAGDTIKVAAGTYYSGTNQTNGTVLIDSVSILGGYPNTGTATNAQRNPSSNQTIISGYQNSSTTSADWHVLMASGPMNSCSSYRMAVIIPDREARLMVADFTLKMGQTSLSEIA
jgi:hypothetical protein